MKALVLALAVATSSTSTATYTPRELRLWRLANRAATLAEVRTVERDAARVDVARLEEALAAVPPCRGPEQGADEGSFVLGMGVGAGVVAVLGLVLGIVLTR